MNFEYEAHIIGSSEKPFTVLHESKEIGQMERYFKNQSRTPQFDVNISAEDFQTGDVYTINQTVFKMMGRIKWEIKKNNETIGNIATPKGLFKKHQIDISIEEQPKITFQATWNGTGKIIDKNNNEIGMTSKATRFKRVYEGQINEGYLNIPWILFYSLVHTFWCGSNNN